MTSALLMAALAAAVAGDGATTSMSYLALGDSYTIGEGVPEAGRWPVQLAEALRRRGLRIDSPHIVARTGWSTDELSAAMDAAALAPRYDLVSLLIGVNNQYRSRSLDNYREEFAALLQRALALADGRAGRVVVLSIPDWGVTPFARSAGRDAAQIARELDGYNAAAAAICAEAKVAFVDITAISRAADPEAQALTEDGLHPSAAQYARWVAAALPVVEPLLTRH